MIHIYYLEHDVNCKKKVNRLFRHLVTEGVYYEAHSMSEMTPELFTKIISKSVNGFTDVMIEERKNAPNKKEIRQVHNMKFSEAIRFLLSKPYLIKYPIVIDEDRKLYYTGIRPDEYRRLFRDRKRVEAERLDIIKRAMDVEAENFANGKTSYIKKTHENVTKRVKTGEKYEL